MLGHRRRADRMDRRALEREDRAMSLLKEMHNDARADRVMMQEALVPFAEERGFP
jgi:hypothetical protein